jgi:hypothetical protein
MRAWYWVWRMLFIGCLTWLACGVTLASDRTTVLYRSSVTQSDGCTIYPIIIIRSTP